MAKTLTKRVEVEMSAELQWEDRKKSRLVAHGPYYDVAKAAQQAGYTSEDSFKYRIIIEPKN